MIVFFLVYWTLTACLCFLIANNLFLIWVRTSFSIQTNHPQIYQHNLHLLAMDAHWKGHPWRRKLFDDGMNNEGAIKSNAFIFQIHDKLLKLLVLRKNLHFIFELEIEELATRWVTDSFSSSLYCSSIAVQMSRWLMGEGICKVVRETIAETPFTKIVDVLLFISASIKVGFFSEKPNISLGVASQRTCHHE